MPILVPILIGSAIVAVSGLGAKSTYDGISDFREAKRKAEAAQKRHALAVKSLEKLRAEVNRCLEIYGERILEIHAETIERMVDILQQIGKIAEANPFDVLSGLDVDRDKLGEFKREIFDIELAGGGVGATLSAIAAGKVTAAAVGAFGKASTGVAISGLSGAAAKSATLAWLGGGSLAAGGGGVALGGVILGGIAVAPAIFVGGFVIARKGTKALTQARQYEADVEVKIARIGNLKAFLNRVKERIDEMDGLIIALNERAGCLMDEIDPENFDISSDEDIKTLASAMQITIALKEIMMAPILDEKGELSPESRRIQAKYKKLVN